ncbi:MAG TPA: S8 family serine peptidase [Candidatus Binatia bacterium]|nr:S8 family serine peptidase [Candidatus Binatia bacterium]
MPARFLLALSLAVLVLPVRGMDQARVETRVDDAVSRFGVTGRNVLVAILDRGIDWQNNDFRNTNGSTRIAAIFDLTDDTGSNSPANPYGLGTIYTRPQIDGALSHGTNLVTRDALGHGTTTAAIACGNGRNLWKYRGVAFNATIIAVKIVAENVPAHNGQPAETAFYDPSRIPVAINFVRDQARTLGMPAVMLLNIGASGGPADGTSSLCQALDAAVGPGIPGLVFVTGSSDDGGTPNHAGGTVTQGGTTAIGIHMGNPAPLIFDLWYPTNDQFDVTIQTPNGTFGPYPSPSLSLGYDNQSAGDFQYYHYSGDWNSYGAASGKREIYVSLLGPSGDYTIALSGANVADGRFDASLDPARFWDTSANSNYFTTYVVAGKTVWDLAGAPNNVCPNDYVHRTNWVDIDGIPRSNGGQGGIGQLWEGTGIGPTYDGRLGVDVSAPGDSVFTAYNTNSYWATFRFNEIQDGNGLYGRASATSAANPIVTGIIALMLQMNPKLDAGTVKHLLQQSARADSFTGAVPNVQWGYGKVDAYATVSAVTATLPLLSFTGLSNHQAHVTVRQTVPGWQYVLQVSTNFSSWAPLLTNTAATNSLQMLDTNALNQSRFYRVAIP